MDVFVTVMEITGNVIFIGIHVIMHITIEAFIIVIKVFGNTSILTHIVLTIKFTWVLSMLRRT